MRENGFVQVNKLTASYDYVIHVELVSRIKKIIRKNAASKEKFKENKERFKDSK